MQWFIPIVAGIAVALAWMAVWAYGLHLFGIAFSAVFMRRPEDRASRRERIKRMGKLRYILIFGVLGFGLAFGLGTTAVEFLGHDSHGWVEACAKFVFSSLFFGGFYGAWTWSEIRDPVPFPPNYGPPK